MHPNGVSADAGDVGPEGPFRPGARGCRGAFHDLCRAPASAPLRVSTSVRRVERDCCIPRLCACVVRVWQRRRRADVRRVGHRA